MRVTIDRDALADAVAWTTRVLPGRPALPVLAGILLDARDDSGTLEFACFDYEVSARCDAAARVDEPGRVLVQGRLLADIARTLPAAEVTLTLDAGKVVIRCGSTRFALPVMPVEDYPQLPAPRSRPARCRATCSRPPWPRSRSPLPGTRRRRS